MNTLVGRRLSGISFQRFKRVARGSLVGTVGYVLSPLSFWNDLYVNVPLAYVGGWLASLFYRPAFLPAFIVSYWITNVAGFLLMHLGVRDAVGKKTGMSKKSFLKDMAFSTGYVLVLVLLIHVGVLRPIDKYF